MEAGLQLGNLVVNSSHIAVSQYLTKIQNSELLSQELIHRDHAEMTPLHLAVRKGDFEMVKVLLSFDAPTEIKIGNKNVKAYAREIKVSTGTDESKRIYALIKTRGKWQAVAARTQNVLFSKSIKAIEEVVDKVQGAQGKTAILCLGVTGEGKSSLLNFLSGTEYRSVYVRGIPKVEVVAGEEIARVGNTTISQTLLPQVIPVPKKSFVWVDLPGFGDTRGTPEEITAAAGIGMITKQLQKIQSILFVVSWNSLIDARMGPYREAAHSVGAMMSRDQETNNNVLLVVTKPPQGLKTEDVKERLQELSKDEKWENVPNSHFSRDDMNDDMWKKHCLKTVTEAIIKKNNIIMADITNPDSRQALYEKLDQFVDKLKRPDQFDFSNYSQFMERFILIMESIIVNYNDLARNHEAQLEKLVKLRSSIKEIEQEQASIQKSIDSYTQQMTKPFTEQTFNEKIAEEKAKLKDLRNRARESSETLRKAELAAAISSSKLESISKEGERLIDTVIRDWDCKSTESRVEKEVKEIGPIFVPGRGMFMEVEIRDKVIPAQVKTVSEPVNWSGPVPIQRFVDQSREGTFVANGFVPGATHLSGTFTSSSGAQGRVSLSVLLYGKAADFPETKDLINKYQTESNNNNEMIETAKKNYISEDELNDISDKVNALELEKISAVGSHERTKSICEMKIQFERSQLEKIQEKFSETMKQIADDQNKVEDLKLQLEVNDDLFSKLKEVIRILDLKGPVFTQFLELSSKNRIDLELNRNNDHIVNKNSDNNNNNNNNNGSYRELRKIG